MPAIIKNDVVYAGGGTTDALTSSDVVDNLESTASHLPASANIVREVNEKIQNLNVRHDNVAGSFSRKISFIRYSTVLVSIISNNGGNAYGCWLVQGYGKGAIRIHIATIQTGTLFDYTILEDEAAVVFSGTLADAAVSNISFLVLSGEIRIS